MGPLVNRTCEDVDQGQERVVAREVPARTGGGDGSTLERDEGLGGGIGPAGGDVACRGDPLPGGGDGVDESRAGLEVEHVDEARAGRGAEHRRRRWARSAGARRESRPRLGALQPAQRVEVVLPERAAAVEVDLPPRRRLDVEAQPAAVEVVDLLVGLAGDDEDARLVGRGEGPGAEGELGGGERVDLQIGRRRVGVGGDRQRVQRMPGAQLGPHPQRALGGAGGWRDGRAVGGDLRRRRPLILLVTLGAEDERQ